MVFSSILVRRGSALAIGAQKKHFSSPMKFLSPTTTTTTTTNFSSLANNKEKPPSDHKLVRVLESEIKCSQESDDHKRVEKTPHEFPFKFEDIPGQQTLILRREYNGEIIKVDVHMPSLVTGNDDGDDEDDTEKAAQSSIPLVVTVSKDNGPYLEFGVTAFPDEVSIDSMSVKESDSSKDQIPYEGPDFSSMDENLQKVFHKYLEIRGIRPITTNFLYEYMINKDSREYLMWLKKLKKFIEK